MDLFKRKQKQAVPIYAPVDGKILPLEQVDDPVFSQKMMGEGVAIMAEGEVIKAPADGTLSMIAETRHAFGMTLANGLEVMVHVGLETVGLKGKGFEVVAKVNELVKAGTPILRVDSSIMKGANISLCTPVILINHQEHPFTSITKEGHASAGETVLFEVE